LPCDESALLVSLLFEAIEASTKETRMKVSALGAYVVVALFLGGCQAEPGGDAEETEALTGVAGTHKVDAYYYDVSTKFPHTYLAANAADLMAQCRQYIGSWTYGIEVLSGGVSVDGGPAKSVWDINTWQTFNTLCSPIVTGAVQLGLPNPPAATHHAEGYLAFEYRPYYGGSLQSAQRDLNMQWTSSTDMVDSCTREIERAIRSVGYEDWRSIIITRFSVSTDFAPIRWYIDTVWGNGAYLDAAQTCQLLVSSPGRTM
jgi:hypothetical protein